MPLTAHFLAVTPDGCPEEIEAGPLTEERAKDALFAWEMNHGCPARVVVLSEPATTDKYVCVVEGERLPSGWDVSSIDTLSGAQRNARAVRSMGANASVYALVKLGG